PCPEPSPIILTRGGPVKTIRRPGAVSGAPPPRPLIALPVPRRGLPMNLCNGLLPLVLLVPAAPPPREKQDDLSGVAQRFAATVKAMQPLRDTLQSSMKKDDRARGAMLKEALDRAAASGLQKRLDRVAALDLRALRDPDKVRAAAEAVGEAEAELRAV